MSKSSSGLVMPTLLLGLAAILVTEIAAGPAAAGRAINATAEDVFRPFQGDRFDGFDWNLCKNLARKTSGNVLISPISVKLALILLYEGSQGQTRHELGGALELPGGVSTTRDRFSAVIRSFQTKQPDYEFDISTRLFFDLTVSPLQSWSSTIKTFYSADIVTTNMTDSHVALALINNWVRNATHGHVEKILSDEEKLKDSLFLVMNALYFKGSWRHPFMSNMTRYGNFYTDVSRSVDVQFMSTGGRFRYTDSAHLDAQILRLPYLGNKFAMFIVLPQARTGLRQLLLDINPYILRREIATMEERAIDVIIPKFKIEFTSHLEAVLRELGISDIFDNTAILSGIFRRKAWSPHLRVSDFVQKSGVEVNEAGTTAHALTEVLIGNKISDTTFNAAHPFLFFIEDETTGTVVFVGKVTNPLETSGTLEEPVPEFPTRLNEAPIEETPLINTSGKIKV